MARLGSVLGRLGHVLEHRCGACRFLNGFLINFLWIFHRKMDANWHPHLIKNRHQLRKAIFKESCSPCSESSNSQDSGDEVGSKNHSKINQKMMPRSMVSRHRFFIKFSSFFEPSWPPGRLLGASWEPPGGILARLGSVLGASWGRLGASWAILGHLGASWSVLGRLGLKKPPNINLSK